MTEQSDSELHLLLIEDIQADADLITYELRKANVRFTAKCVASKHAFLEQIRAHAPDAIISDFSMPQFNALDALEMLHAHRLEVPFILVTGSQSEEVAVQCIKQGADDYILKASLKRLPSALLGAVKKKRAENERERAEEALRRSEEYFRSLIDNSSDLITIVSLDGVVLFQSPSVERVLGYQLRELHAKPLSEFLHPNDISPVAHALQDELGGRGAGRPIEYRVRHKDGSWRYLEGMFKNLLENPAVTGVVINSRDVTERKLAEERIREQAALLNKAQDAILVMDLDRRLTFWNQSAEDLYGWTAQEAVGRTAEELFSPDPQKLSVSLKDTLQEGEWQGELLQVARDGREILVESRWSLVRDSENRPKSILLINSDITEKKRLEAHFLRAQRMESIGTLAGGIAHDLNNVLTPILMAVKLLRDLDGEPPGALLDTLEASAHRGASIVQQVLSFARGVEGERTVLQVKHPLSEVIKIAKDVFPPSVQLRPNLPKDLWPVMGDPTQLHQVFMNLLVNAKDAMPHGGRLQVEAENAKLDESYARMQPDARPGKYLVVTVSDTGSGIPPGLLGKIFEPFFTTKEVGKGTGLGLSTAMAIVRSHGGFLTVYSEIGKGTCFKVYLPAAEAECGESETDEKLPLPIGQGESILVVDDEVAIREIIKVTLENNGYRVITASDGTEAVAAFATREREVKAVVVDVMMPFMDGPSTVRALQKLDPGMKFLAISGLMDNDKVSEMSELGNIAFLAKPFTTEQILTSLAHLFRNRGADNNHSS